MNADVCNWETVVLFFHGIQCDTPKKTSRGKNLIIVPLCLNEWSTQTFPFASEFSFISHQ